MQNFAYIRILCKMDAVKFAESNIYRKIMKRNGALTGSFFFNESNATRALAGVT